MENKTTTLRHNVQKKLYDDEKNATLATPIAKNARQKLRHNTPTPVYEQERFVPRLSTPRDHEVPRTRTDHGFFFFPWQRRRQK
jgi:hypothetical protein